MPAGRSIADLERHVGPRRERRRLVCAYDTGDQIDLRYQGSEPPPPPPAAAPPAAASPDGDAAPVPAPTPPVAAPPPPVAPPAQPVAAPPPAAPSPPPAAPPPAPSEPVERGADLPDEPPSAPAAPADPAPAAPETGVEPKGSYSHDDDEKAIAAALENDIKAILARAAPEDDESGDNFLMHARDNARTSNDLFGDDEEEQEDAAPQEEEEGGASRLLSSATGHDVFDRLAFANQFDVGPVKVDLGAQFDAFDESIVKAETAKARRAQTAQRAPQPIAHMQALDDLSGLRKSGFAGAVAEQLGAEEEAAAASAAAMDAEQSFSVVYDVPLVPQQTSMSCWAAAAAMLAAWRDRVSADPGQVAAGAGHWAQYQAGLAAEDTTVFDAWGLVPEPAQTYTIEGFRRLLEHWGPLWTAAATPGPHVRVVRGIEGDGTPDGTRVHILDPWEPGMATFRQPNAGGRYTETYAEYERKQATLARGEMTVEGVYVAHVKEPRR